MSSYPYLYRDPTSTGNRMSASWSCWVKRWGHEGTFWVFNGGDTKDNTLVRNSNVTSGSEWDVSSNSATCE